MSALKLWVWIPLMVAINAYHHKAVSLNPIHSVYLMQHYVIKFVSDLQQVCGFLRTLCDKVCQWLAAGLWFSPVSSTIKTDCHKITEILLKVVLNTITLTSLYVLSNQLTLKLIIYKLSTGYISIYKCQLWAKIKHIF